MVSFRVKRRRSRQHKKGAQLRAQLVPRKIVEVERDALERQATGPAVSKLGSVVTRTALPLVALIVLGAGPREMAYLVVSASLAVLLVGLLAGAWVDRLRRRPLLIGTDVIRAVLLFSIPVTYALGTLEIWQVYAVAFLDSCLATLFSAAYPAYVPSLIGVERVVEGNSKLAMSASIA